MVAVIVLCDVQIEAVRKRRDIRLDAAISPAAATPNPHGPGDPGLIDIEGAGIDGEEAEHFSVGSATVIRAAGRARRASGRWRHQFDAGSLKLIWG